jgi:hypothetical protein
VEFWAALALIASLHAQRSGPDAGRVVTEFRVFDGSEEITSTTRLRVVPMGRRGAPPIEVQGSSVALPPAVYDVDAMRVGSGGVTSVKSIERLAVMHYPDEGGRHLEVINFQPGYGALQLRSTRGRLDPQQVSIFRAGIRTTPMSQPIPGDDYVLVVVPAGQYDVRVQQGNPGAADAQWLVAIDVPSDRTRLKLVDAP